MDALANHNLINGNGTYSHDKDDDDMHFLIDEGLDLLALYKTLDFQTRASITLIVRSLSTAAVTGSTS